MNATKRPESNTNSPSNQLALPNHLDPTQNYLFHLNNLSLIQVIGDKALDFLQGQLSCDIRLVTANRMQQGALCNLQGRVLALMDVIDYDNAYYLILPTNLVSSTLKNLEKVALLSRIRFKTMEKIGIWGLYTPHSLPKSLPTVTLYPISAQQSLVIDFASGNEAPNELLQTEVAVLDEQTWHFLQVQAQRIQIYPETQGLFTPHRLNLHQTGTVSFNKGCYKGQEIIARTHYRATLKHELLNKLLVCRSTPRRGAKLFEPGTQLEIGELIDYCPLATPDHYLLVCSLLKTADKFFQFTDGDITLSLDEFTRNSMR